MVARKALRMGQRRRNGCDRQGRGVGGQYALLRDDLLKLFEKRLLDIELFNDRLNNQITACKGL